LFTVIRNTNISIKEKVKRIKKLLGIKPPADINAQDGKDNWNTALHMAIERNQPELVNLLLIQGADTTIANGDGRIPLTLAEVLNCTEIIDVLKKFLAQEELSPSDTDKLKPLRADEKLKLGYLKQNFKKLRRKDLKQSIVQFYENKQLSAIDQLKAKSFYPTPYVLAQFASKAYDDNEYAQAKPFAGWKFLRITTNTKNGYFGTAYLHPKYQQVVIAHRGTDTSNFIAFLRDFYTDVEGVFRNEYVGQMKSAITFANEVVAVLQEIEEEKEVSFELFFTGHSLGGWLAQIATFSTEYLEVREGVCVRKQERKKYVTHSYHPHTVVFDSPGCKTMLEKMAKNHGISIDLQHLDISSYLSAPNRINTCNSHVGTVYRILINVSNMGFLEKHTVLYTVATHKMSKILEVFDCKTEEGKNNNGETEIREMSKWPLCKGITGGAQWKMFFTYAKPVNNYHPEENDNPCSKVTKCYQPIGYDVRTKRLSIFTQDEQEFLREYLALLQLKKTYSFMGDFFPLKLNRKAGNDVDNEIEVEVGNLLANYELYNERIRCEDTRTLDAMIPRVRRLLWLFPDIKEKLKNIISQ
jgi:hypothetical protein